MHRATPLSSSFRAFTGGGTRSAVDEIDDSKLMQEHSGNFMAGESRKGIEAPQNYGFTSVVMPAVKDALGKITDSAEAVISFMGGNRSFPVAGVMDDRRHRLFGLQPGDVGDVSHRARCTANALYRAMAFFSGAQDKTDRMQLVPPPQQQQQSGGGGAARRLAAARAGAAGGRQSGKQHEGQQAGSAKRTRPICFTPTRQNRMHGHRHQCDATRAAVSAAAASGRGSPSIKRSTEVVRLHSMTDDIKVYVRRQCYSAARMAHGHGQWPCCRASNAPRIFVDMGGGWQSSRADLMRETLKRASMLERASRRWRRAVASTVPDVRLVQDTRFPRYSVTIDWNLLGDGTLDDTQALATAVIVALGTNALADATELLPDPDSTDRAGWWGDYDADTIWNAWPIGAKLWLLRRSAIESVASRQGSTVARVLAYVRLAIQPFVDQRIASRFRRHRGARRQATHRHRIVIYRGPSPAIEMLYSVLWDEQQYATQTAHN